MSETITTSNNITTTTYAPTVEYPIWLTDLITKPTTNKNHFSGFFARKNMPEKIYITQVIYSDPATIVFWNDGSKTVSKCHGDDVYTPETGLTLCILKKLIGPSAAKELFEDWIIYGDGIVRIKDVRNKHR